MPRVAKGTGVPFDNLLLNTRRAQERGAQDEEVIGRPLFWILFFGRAKKSSSPSGARTRLTKSVATATQKSILFEHQILFFKPLTPTFSFMPLGARGEGA